MAEQILSEAAGQTGDPSVRSAVNTAMLERVTQMRNVYGGTQTLRAAAETYLPKFEKETQPRYDARLASTFCLNKLREAVDAASAKPFKTLVTLQNNIDPDLDLWIKDIDLQRNHLHIFAHKFFNDALLIGQSHILVDHPTTLNMPNLGAQQAAGVRPFFKHIREDDTRAIYSEYVGGRIQVTHARFASSRVVRTADFKEEVYNQIYVLEVPVGAAQGIVQLWEQAAKSAGGQWTFVSESPLTLSEVPLVTMYAGEKEAEYLTRPTFLDLAGKQIEHWQSSSEQRSILSAARFPMLACSGVDIDPADESGFAIGPYKVLYSPVAEGRWYYVEPKGEAIKSGVQDLRDLEMQMDMMALNPSVETHRQYVPQNERDIQESRVHSVIHDQAMSCRDALQKAIQLAGLWVNKDFSAVTVNITNDFANTSDKLKQLNVLLGAFDKGAISPESWVREARNLDLFSDDLDMNAEVLAIKARMALAVAPAEGQAAPSPNDLPAGGSPLDNSASATAKPATPKVDFPAGQLRPTRED